MKRRAVAAVTFIAGLYYFLEFVLPPQVGGDFDQARLGDPDVQRRGNRFLMWYVGSSQENSSAIGLALSDAGERWQKWPHNPVLRPVSTSSFDARGLASPSVVQEADGSFTMFYIGHGADAADRVGCARSPDGQRWRRAGVVLDLATSPWMKPRLTALRVHREASVYRMWLAGTFRWGSRTIDGVSLAFSSDGRTWTLDPHSPVLRPERTGWDSFRILSLDAERAEPQGYRLWYVGTHQERQGDAWIEIGQVGLATSRDGVHWQKHRRNPLPLPRSENVTSVGVVALGPAEAPRYRLFYSVEAGKSIVQASGNAEGPEWTLPPSPAVLTVGQPGQSTYLSDWSVPIADFLVVIAAMAAGLSLYSLGKANLAILLRRAPGRAVSGWDRAGAAAFFASFVLMAIFAHWRQADEGHVCRKIYNLLFFGFLFPFGASSMGLLAFYLASAAYRAFKIKSAEAALLIVSATVVMLGQVPLGQWLTQGLPRPLQIQTWSAWILYIINGAALRGVALGAAIGALAMALRLWLSLERREE